MRLISFYFFFSTNSKQLCVLGEFVWTPTQLVAIVSRSGGEAFCLTLFLG